jgi:hypothetical protein
VIWAACQAPFGTRERGYPPAKRFQDRCSERANHGAVSRGLAGTRRGLASALSCVLTARNRDARTNAVVDGQAAESLAFISKSLLGPTRSWRPLRNL